MQEVNTQNYELDTTCRLIKAQTYIQVVYPLFLFCSGR